MVEKDVTNDKYFHESPFASKGFHNFETSSRLPRHRWYYFKEGFSASLVEEAIGNVVNSKNKQLSILDPFCGSGTTPLTASLLGHKCTGIEVNPFLAFVSRAKATPRKWRKSNFTTSLHEIIRKSSIERNSPLEGFSTFTHKEGSNKWLFNRSVLRKFESIMNAIRQVLPAQRDAFVLSAMVAAFECSNVRRDGKALRYKKDWKRRKYSGIDLQQRFKEHALMILDDAITFPIEASNCPEILNADSRGALRNLADESLDLVITSPPYLNSFDYSDVYRPELFLGNFVKNNKELAGIRLNTIRSHIQIDWPRQTTIECDLLSPILERLEKSKKLWDSRLPIMVEAYFDDLSQVFNEVYKKLKHGGKIWLVVSTSSYGGVHIPVDLILAAIATDNGFVLEGIHRLRDLRTSSQQWKQLNTKSLPLRESLIILTKR